MNAVEPGFAAALCAAGFVGCLAAPSVQAQGVASAGAAARHGAAAPRVLAGCATIIDGQVEGGAYQLPDGTIAGCATGSVRGVVSGGAAWVVPQTHR